MAGRIEIGASVRNTGERGADEVVQLYVRDPVANVTRPVRELKAFTRIHLEPGECRRVSFTLSAGDLAFYGREDRWQSEPGLFHAWIGGSSTADLRSEFLLTESHDS
jgi:beta-glucosidase